MELKWKLGGVGMEWNGVDVELGWSEVELGGVGMEWN